LRREHDQHLGNACRIAWDEGRAAGREEGRADLLRDIDVQLGDTVRLRIEAIEQTLYPDQPVEGKAEEASKAQLHRQLERALDLLRGLVEAHHCAFRPELSSRGGLTFGFAHTEERS
jgi:hypothetical protein